MTDKWTTEGLRGYATRDETEAVRLFMRRHGKAPTSKVCIKDKVSCIYYLGPVEDSKHGNR